MRKFNWVKVSGKPDYIASTGGGVLWAFRHRVSGRSGAWKVCRPFDGEDPDYLSYGRTRDEAATNFLAGIVETPSD